MMNIALPDPVARSTIRRRTRSTARQASQLLTLLLTALVSVFAASPAWAGTHEPEPYSAARFDALTRAGEVVLVDVFAPWCPTCARQKKALAAYRAANPERSFRTLVVDFDGDKDAVRRFRAPRQSTLVLFVGTRQAWMSVAETRPEVIAAALDAAIQAPSATTP